MTAEFLHTSGNLQADRRYEYALQMDARGDREAALDLLAQAAELAPDWPVLPFVMGNIYAALGREVEAMDAYKRALALDPEDHQGALLKMQILGGQGMMGRVIERALPRAYVETLFDQYAPRFDEHLVETLEYQVPRQIHDMYWRCRSAPPARILDLGCGTGLAGEYFARHKPWIEGVDLSSGMLAAAESKGVYSRLVHEDLRAHMEQSEDRFNLIMAADVLMYLGDMAPIFAAARARLASGGLLVFSLQKQEDGIGTDFTLDETHRFSHNKDYVERALAKAGLAVLSCEQVVLRKDRGADVPGYLYACGREETLMDPDTVSANPYTGYSARLKPE